MSDEQPNKQPKQLSADERTRYTERLAEILQAIGVDDADDKASKYLQVYIDKEYDLRALDCDEQDTPRALGAYSEIIGFLSDYVEEGSGEVWHNSELSDLFTSSWRFSGAFRVCVMCDVTGSLDADSEEDDNSYTDHVIDAYFGLFYHGVLDDHQV